MAGHSDSGDAAGDARVLSQLQGPTHHSAASAYRLTDAARDLAEAGLGDAPLGEAVQQILRVVGDEVPSSGCAIAALRSSAVSDRPVDPLDAGKRTHAASPDLVVWLAATGAASLLDSRPVELEHSIVARLDAAGGIGGFRHDPADLIVELESISDGVGVLAMRLVVRGRAIGALLVTFPSDPLAGAAREAMERIAAPLTLALESLLRRTDEERQRAHERMLVAALGAMGDPVLLLDASGRILGANAEALRTYGYSREVLSRLHFARLEADTPEAEASLRPQSVTPHLLHSPPECSRGVWSAQRTHQRQDGSLFPARVTRAGVHDDRGRIAGEVVLVRDLTSEQQMEAHIRQHDKLASLGELVAGVAHELNNPLTGIAILAELLLDDPLTDDQHDSLRLVKSEADRATSIIRDLMLFARRTSARYQPIDLNELVRTTLRLRTYHLRATNIDFHLELHEPLPAVLGDEQKLQQVLLNLLGNAEDALHDSHMREILVRTSAEADRVILEVSDTGRGMSDEARRQAFEPFFTTKREGAGTGLGLSVSYGIVEAHGGLLTLDSTPGRGTVVRVLLPLPENTIDREAS